MASPSRPPQSAVDQWTETDQEIIETLLMVNPSNAVHAGAPHAQALVYAPGSVPSLPSVQVPMTTTAAYTIPATVPVAYWVPTPPTQAYYAHPYHAVQPTYFVHAGEPRRSSVDMDLQEILSEEERKAKHREVQRRFVQRKKEQMDRIRREAANLEKRASFLRLNQEQVTLEKEKADLEDQIDDAEDLQIPTEEEIRLILENECRAAEKGFESISDSEYNELLLETMESVSESVIKDTRKLDDRTKVQVMGWTGRRVLESGSDDKAAMRFEIAKQFARIKPNEIVDRAWNEIVNLTGYERLFSSSILMKAVKLQQINDDAVVVFKTMFNPRTAAIHHSVDLLCRIQMNDETLIISRDINVPSVRASVGDPEGWCRSLNVLGFASMPKPPVTPAQATAMGAAPTITPRSDGTSFRYNCCIRGTCEADLRFWMAEILFVVVRFESMLIAPLFTLSAP